LFCAFKRIICTSAIATRVASDHEEAFQLKIKRPINFFGVQKKYESFLERGLQQKEMWAGVLIFLDRGHVAKTYDFVPNAYNHDPHTIQGNSGSVLDQHYPAETKETGFFVLCCDPSKLSVNPRMCSDNEQRSDIPHLHRQRVDADIKQTCTPLLERFH
jgi:hypothetical protein